MDETLKQKLEAVGFYDEKSNDMAEHEWLLTKAINPEDLSHVKKIVGKNHFEPRGYRYLFIGTTRMAQGGNGYYATSNINGDYRGYKCRYSYDRDIANIFASGYTLEECVNNFIDKYNRLEYNE